MSKVRLTTASYVVLGLIEFCQPATAYDLKRLASISVVNFWALPHTQLYSESARLANEGLLDEEREEGGRRRRLYRLTEQGRAALDEWRAAPANEPCEVHDPATLKLYFGGDPASLAAGQIDVHEAKLHEYEQTGETLDEHSEDWPRGMRLALEAGISFETHMIEFWRSVAERETNG